MQDTSEQALSVGVELATSIMMNGRPADILAPIVQNSYSPQAQEQVAQIINRVPNASMNEMQKAEVEHLLDNYIDSSEGRMKSVAIESLAGLVADNSQKLKSLFHQYAQDENDSVRYSAIQALYQLEPAQFDDTISGDLKTIANNTSESLSVRASAMELLASYQDMPES
ncbi:HEAT repeat domain-containing protein [Vibrio quintilis]|nr:HEAT repeat domain-containing protein [Vibrio quintilis]